MYPVAIVGVGAIGSHLAEMLAKLGARGVTLIDFDEVDDVNLGVQGFYERDIGRFKTPTIRNIELTAPYMHDGSQKTLEEVVDFYDQGGEKNPLLDGGIRPLKLTDQEKADLVEFMKALTSPSVAQGNFATLSH